MAKENLINLLETLGYILATLVLFVLAITFSSFELRLTYLVLFIVIVVLGVLYYWYFGKNTKASVQIIITLVVFLSLLLFCSLSKNGLRPINGLVTEVDLNFGLGLIVFYAPWIMLANILLFLPSLLSGSNKIIKLFEGMIVVTSFLAIINLTFFR